MSSVRQLVHGSRNTYDTYGCRCEYCRAAYAIYRAASRESDGVPEKGRYWPVGDCAVCAHHRRTGVSLGLHTFKGALHA